MMVEKRSRAGQGTFARLYDVQEELSQRGVKPLGRPRKKIRRKPTTVHLTQSEVRKLSKLHLLVNEHFSVNRSELVGVAIDALALLIERKSEEIIKTGGVRDVEALRQSVIDFMKS
jgi:predicted HTH domain antitoxin